MIAWLKCNIEGPAQGGGARVCYRIHFGMRPTERLVIAQTNNGALFYYNGPNQRVGAGHALSQRGKTQGSFHKLHVRIGLNHILQALLSISKSNWGGIAPAPYQLPEIPAFCESS
ncbi:MAG: hypothetical protein ABSH17_07460 [Syntrophobacteraceae bacterium]|jgi:hypothetical protein